MYWVVFVKFDINVRNHTLIKSLKNLFDNISNELMEAAIAREFTVAESNRLHTFIETVESQSLIK